MESFCDCGNEKSGFHKMRIISRLAQDLLACQEGCHSDKNFKSLNVAK